MVIYILIFLRFLSYQNLICCPEDDYLACQIAVGKPGYMQICFKFGVISHYKCAVIYFGKP